MNKFSHVLWVFYLGDDYCVFYLNLFFQLLQWHGYLQMPEWLNGRLRTKWLWVQVQVQSIADASLLDNFSRNFNVLRVSPVFLTHGLDVRYLKKAFLKMLPLMTLHCMGTAHKFYTYNLSWSRRNVTTDNRLQSLRNILIACLLFLKQQILDIHSSLDADYSSIFLCMFQNS